MKSLVKEFHSRSDKACKIFQIHQDKTSMNMTRVLAWHSMLYFVGVKGFLDALSGKKK